MFPGQDTKTTYTASDLSGTWLEEYTLCYWVYTLTKDDSGEYYWGKTWDEADDVHESDLEYHGNGWFKWSITNNNLVQIHMMNISEATVPKTYTVTSCNGTTLQRNCSPVGMERLVQFLIFSKVRISCPVTSRLSSSGRCSFCR